MLTSLAPYRHATPVHNSVDSTGLHVHCRLYPDNQLVLPQLIVPTLEVTVSRLLWYHALLFLRLTSPPPLPLLSVLGIRIGQPSKEKKESDTHRPKVPPDPSETRPGSQPTIAEWDLIGSIGV